MAMCDTGLTAMCKMLKCQTMCNSATVQRHMLADRGIPLR